MAQRRLLFLRLDVNPLAGEAIILHVQAKAFLPVQAVDDEAAVGVGGGCSWPQWEALGRVPKADADFLARLRQRGDVDLDSLGWLALQIDQPAPKDLLHGQLHRYVRLRGLDVERPPAEAMAGGDAHDITERFRQPRPRPARQRCGSRHCELAPALPIALRLAPHLLCGPRPFA